MTELTPARLLEVTAADMLRVAAAASAGPWKVHTAATGIRADIPYAFVVRPNRPGEPETVSGFSAVAERHNGGTVADVEHIAAWQPDVAQAVAAWLLAEARAYGARRPTDQQKLIDVGPCGPLKVAICRAWWASRGLGPEDTTR